MIATTISSSIRVKPFWFFIHLSLSPLVVRTHIEQGECHGLSS
jgi:hypothetical protein